MKPTTEKTLPKLQRKIILKLAENKAQTIYENVNTEPTTHYRPSHAAFKLLEAKGYIKKVSFKEHWGRKYAEFWTTNLGIFTALCEGANLKTLLKRTKDIYPEDQDLQCLLEISPIFPEAFKMAHSILLDKRKLESIDIATIMAILLLKKLNPDETKRFITILKSYPEYRQLLNEVMEKLEKNLPQTLKEIRGDNHK